jgi:hypothetical protein
MGEVPRTLKVCQMLVDDNDDMVVETLSWALRVLVVHDPEAARGFLAGLVNRGVRNKLKTGPRTHGAAM